MKKLFGQNIKPDCQYCVFASFDDDVAYCTKGKLLSQKKCKTFKYDPLLRKPQKQAQKKAYTQDDFKL